MRRRRILLWQILLALVLVVWVGGLLWHFVEKRRIEAFTTGDALLDRYLELSDASGNLTSNAMQQLKAEFATDARVYELLLAMTPSPERDGLLSEDNPTLEWAATDKSVLVEEARENGVPLSPALLRVKLDSMEGDVGRAEWLESEEDKNAFAVQLKMPQLEKSQKKQQALKHSALGLDAMHGRERRDALYDDLVALAPDMSGVYLRRAWLHMARGDYEEAIVDIERAMDAPLQARPSCYPISDDVDYEWFKLELPAVYAEKLYLAAIWNHGYANEHKEILRREKDLYTIMWLMAIERDDRRGMNLLHRSACQIGLSGRDRGDMLAALTSLVVLKGLNKSLAEALPQGAPEQQRLAAYSGECDKMRQAIDAINQQRPAVNALTPSSKPLAWLYEVLDFPSDAMRWRALQNDNKLQRQLIRQQVMPILEHIAEFDWEILDWPTDRQVSAP